jgi:hypothetical protein
MNPKLPVILAVGMLIASVALFTWDRSMESQPVSVQEGELADVPESLRPTTYAPPENIYLPEMMFLVVKDTDKPAISRCKNMSYRTVDAFSRQAHSVLVRKDKKLYTLARIVYSECIDVSLATYEDGI